jgi:pyruvate formate lyase activating enzyme
VLSFGTAGCNLGCRFCQNWEHLQGAALGRAGDEAPRPEPSRARPRRSAAKSVAFTYNDPIIFAEYAMDVADACHAVGVKTVAVTAGYIHAQPRREFFEDRRGERRPQGVHRGFYHRSSRFSHLQPVLDTLEYLVKETQVWTEITTLLIPGHNDSEAEVAELCEWVGSTWGPDVPAALLGVSPRLQARDVPATPAETLRRARKQALAAGLRYVYTGNVHDVAGDTTSCHACGRPLIARDWYRLLSYSLDATGACPDCGTPLAGCFDALGPGNPTRQSSGLSQYPCQGGSEGSQ